MEPRPETPAGLRELLILAGATNRSQLFALASLVSAGILALGLGTFGPVSRVHLFRRSQALLTFSLMAFVAAHVAYLFSATASEQPWAWRGFTTITPIAGLSAILLNGRGARFFPAPRWAVIIDGAVFIVSFFWSLFSFDVIESTLARDWWVRYGIWGVRSFNVALASHVTAATGLLLVASISRGNLRVWYRGYTRRLLEQKAYDECVNACQVVLPACQEADEFYASFESLTGVCHFRNGAFKAAVEAYSRAIAKAPVTRAGYGTPAIKKALVYANRAEAWIELGDFDRAIEDCDSALGVDAQDKYAQRLRTEAQRKRDEHRHESL